MRWFQQQRVRYRLSAVPLIVLVGIWLLILPACTHLSPYHRRDQVGQVRSVPDSAIDYRLLLVGDAGNPDPKGEPTLLLGSIVVGFRKCCSPSPQDMSNGRNRHVRDNLVDAMIEAESTHAAPLVYAAGHDHSLQLFESRHGPKFTLVSGMGSSARSSPVSSDRSTLFAHSNSAQPGFMQIDFLKDGAVRLAVVECTAEQPDGFEAYSTFLAEPK